MSGLPGEISSALGHHSGGAPTQIVNLGGIIPGGTVSNGPPSGLAALSGVLNGTGLSMTTSHTGRVTSNADPIGQFRILVNNQYFINLELTKAWQVCDQMLHWVDRYTGTPGIDGQNRPYAFMAMIPFIYHLMQPDQCRSFGRLLHVDWLTQYGFAGVMRHDNEKNWAGRGDLCQLFNFGGHTKVYDLWQSHKQNVTNTVGAEIGDMLWIVFKRMELHSELDRVHPPHLIDHMKNAAPQEKEYYWTIVPIYTKHNEIVPLEFYYDRHTGARGTCIKVGKVLHIYNGTGSAAIARKLLSHPCNDADYKNECLKLRTLDIHLAYT